MVKRLFKMCAWCIIACVTFGATASVGSQVQVKATEHWRDFVPSAAWFPEDFHVSTDELKQLADKTRPYPKSQTGRVLTTAGGDPCRDNSAALMDYFAKAIGNTLNCANIAGELPGVPGCSVFGGLCPVSCGLCGVAAAAPTCSKAEISLNKQKLTDFIKGLGLCENCAAPPDTENMSFVEKAPFPAITAMKSTSYTTKLPTDPCNFPGVTCDRCGEVVNLLFGFPAPVAIPGKITSTLFELRRMQILMLSRPPFSGPMSVLPADGWAQLTEATGLVLIGMMAGPVPHVGSMPAMNAVGLILNAFMGSIEPLFGGAEVTTLIARQPAALGFPQLSGGIPASICNSTFLFSVTMNAGGSGTLPPCMSNLELMEKYNFEGTSFEGDASPLFASPALKDVWITGNKFSGTLPARMANLTKLVKLNIAGNLFTGTLPDLSLMNDLDTLNIEDCKFSKAGRIGGKRLDMKVAGNSFESVPEDWWVLPQVLSLDLSRNPLKEWPSAGVYSRSFFTPTNVVSCNFGPPKPNFNWPMIETFTLNDCPLDNVDVRTVMVSLGFLPRLNRLVMKNNKLGQDLPMESGGLTPSFDLQSCSNIVNVKGFNSLTFLDMTGNHIQGIGGPPWDSLQTAIFTSNKLAHVHPDWFNAKVYNLDLTDNTELRLDIESPPSACPQQTGGLVADPNTFTSVINQSSYVCTPPCALGFFPRVDITANTSALCKCAPGFAGAGVNCVECSLNEWAPGGTPTCTQCPSFSTTAGKKRQSAGEACLCHAGYYAEFVGTANQRCMPCPKNRYAPTIGTSSVSFCMPCEEGNFSRIGSAQCEPCPANTVGAGSGQGCHCIQGFFMNTTTHICMSCDAILPGSVTSVIGATSSTACDCPKGKVRLDDQCVECPEGVDCPGGQQSLQVLPGYYSEDLTTETLKSGIWKCTSEEACIGGRPGHVCAPHMEGLNCGKCEDGSSPSGGTCEPCTSGESWGAILAFMSIYAVIGAFSYYWNEKSSIVEAFEGVLASVTIGVTLSFMQSLGILNRFSFNWPQEFKDLLDFMKVFVFDFDTFKPACLFGDTLVYKYASSMSTPIVIIGLFFSWCPVSFVLNKLSGGKIKTFSFVSTFNATGMVLQAFYISIVYSVVSVAQCYSNPNGKTTLRGSPFVVCGSGEHWGVVVVAFIAFVLYIIGFLCIALWALRRAPTRISLINFNTQWKFLLFKYHPSKYWFGIVLMFRSILMTLPPVIFPNDSYMQFLWMNGVLVGSVFIQLANNPYLDRYGNWLETGELTFLIIILCLGGWFMNDIERKDDPGRENFLMGLLIGFVAACFLMIFCVFFFALYLALFPKEEEKRLQKSIASWKDQVRGAVDAVAGLEDDQFVKFLMTGTYMDHMNLVKLVAWTTVDLTDTQPAGFFDRRLPKQRSGSNILAQAKDGKSQTDALGKLTRSSSRMSLSSNEGKKPELKEDDIVEPQITPPEHEEVTI